MYPGFLKNPFETFELVISQNFFGIYIILYEKFEIIWSQNPIKFILTIFGPIIASRKSLPSEPYIGVLKVRTISTLKNQIAPKHFICSKLIWVILLNLNFFIFFQRN